MRNLRQTYVASTTSDKLRLGFVPLVDCAPLVAAAEFGFFEQYGLRVQLSRELGWASIRNKMLYGELQVAQAVAGMPLAATLGIGGPAKACCTGMVLNLHGNGITLSNTHFKKGASPAECLQAAVDDVAGERKLVFGTVSLVSSHYFLLRRWLKKAGLDVERDVEIAVVPPPQMPANLQAGNVDGYCVGEPWNSIAVHAAIGFLAASSAGFDPRHPEKVLMVRQSFARRREEEHLKLIAALMDACDFCQQAENHEELAKLLARPEYVGVSKAVIMRSLSGKLALGHGRKSEQPDFHVFSAPEIHTPDAYVAEWVQRGVEEAGLMPEETDLTPAMLQTIYRTDLISRAQLLRESATAEILT